MLNERQCCFDRIIKGFICRPELTAAQFSERSVEGIVNPRLVELPSDGARASDHVRMCDDLHTDGAKPCQLHHPFDGDAGVYASFWHIRAIRASRIRRMISAASDSPCESSSISSTSVSNSSASRSCACRLCSKSANGIALSCSQMHAISLSCSRGDSCAISCATCPTVTLFDIVNHCDYIRLSLSWHIAGYSSASSAEASRKACNENKIKGGIHEEEYQNCCSSRSRNNGGGNRRPALWRGH